MTLTLQPVNRVTERDVFRKIINGTRPTAEEMTQLDDRGLKEALMGMENLNASLRLKVERLEAEVERLKKRWQMEVSDLFLGGIDVQRLKEELIGDYLPLGDALKSLGLAIDEERAKIQLEVEIGLYECPCCKVWFVDEDIDASGYCPEHKNGVCED